MQLETKDEIYSAMVVYSLLTFKDGKVFIPNWELMERFQTLLISKNSLGYVYRVGKGYVEFIFYPEYKGEAGIILELKVDSKPDEAVQQIKDKNYALRFCGRIGEHIRYTGEIIAVGISYDRKTKEHACKVEVLSKKNF